MPKMLDSFLAIKPHFINVCHLFLLRVPFHRAFYGKEAKLVYGLRHGGGPASHDQSHRCFLSNSHCPRMDQKQRPEAELGQVT